MSGWNAYVDTQLVATGAICQAGIFGKADIQCYANAGDFQVQILTAARQKKKQSYALLVFVSVAWACETEYYGRSA